MISLDCREPATVRDTLVQAVGVDNVRIDRMPTADFVFLDHCEHVVGVERKTTSDLLHSFATGRLNAQLSRLVHEFHVPVLLIEGNFGLSGELYVRVNGATTGWRHGALQMALFKLQGAGIRVLHTPDLRGTCDTLRVLHARGLPPSPKCLLAEFSYGQPDTPGSYLDTRLEPEPSGDGTWVQPPRAAPLADRRAYSPARGDCVGKQAPRFTIDGPIVQPRPKGSGTVHSGRPVHDNGSRSDHRGESDHGLEVATGQG
jgi:hypothetical protein